ncbi:MAG: SixA phosphatase family protein [Phycisphaerales bacterium]
MRVFIIRHGKAERQSTTGRDADRVLVARGIRQAEHLGRVLGEAAPGLVLSSPFARAWATAEIVHRAVGGRLEAETRLECDRRVSEATEAIAARASEPTLAIVGHNPQLSALVDHFRGKHGADLRTGEAADLEIDPNAGQGTLVRTWRMDDED